MDNKTKALIIFPLVLIIIFILIANFVNFDEGLPKTEQQIIEFIPSDITIKQRQRVHVSRELESPIDFGGRLHSNLNSYPPVALEALVPQMGFNAKEGLSLIVISEKNRMAIIKGTVVKEGDSIDGMKIAKIESNRVLLTQRDSDKSQNFLEHKWLYMEKTK